MSYTTGDAYLEDVLPDIEKRILRVNPEDYSYTLEAQIRNILEDTHYDFDKTILQRAEDNMLYYYRNKLKEEKQKGKLSPTDIKEVKVITVKLDAMKAKGYHKLDPELQEFKDLELQNK